MLGLAAEWGPDPATCLSLLSPGYSDWLQLPGHQQGRDLGPGKLRKQLTTGAPPGEAGSSPARRP